MSKKPNPELIDADNPEWTEDMFQYSIKFNALPESLQVKLRDWKSEAYQFVSPQQLMADFLTDVKGTAI